MKRIFLAAGFSLAMVFGAFAATERITDYQYDTAGNMVRIQSGEQSNPPVVLSITPSFINIGRSVSMTAVGTDLLAAQLSVNDPNLLISSVVAQKTQVTFRLTALATATIGPAPITFTTGLGSTSFTIQVADVLPGLTTLPNPITLPVAPQATAIRLRFSDPRPSNETYTVAITNPATATVTQSSFTILQGQTDAQIDLTGVALGSTQLDIVLPSKFYFFSFPVFVTPVFAGGATLYSQGAGVGVFLESAATPNVGNRVGSLAVGVFVEDAAANGFADRVFSSAVGVLVESATGALINPILSTAVGVFVESVTGSLGNPLLSPPVGVVLGPLLDTVTPAQLNPGDQLNLTVSGYNLQTVSSVTVIPAGSITLGAFSVNANGTALTVPVTVGPVPFPGNYELIIETPQGFVTLPGAQNLNLTIP